LHLPEEFQLLFQCRLPNLRSMLLAVGFPKIFSSGHNLQRALLLNVDERALLFA